MADFMLPADEAVVVVDEGRFAGAEVTVNRDVGVGVVMDVLRLMERPEGETNDEAIARSQSLFGLLVEIVLRWNLVDRHGKPIPITVEGLARVNPGLIGEIAYGWLASMRQAPAPLGEPSGLGEPPAEPLPQS